MPGGTAHWVFHGGINYNDQEGDVAIVITKADAIVSVSGYTGTAHWVFDGGINYNNQEGDVDIVITPKALTADSASTQNALNIAKDGQVSLRIDVNESGIVDGQSVADLFNGASFQLSVNGQTYGVQADAVVIDGIVYVSFRMSADLKAMLAQDTTATSAKTAPVVGLQLASTSIDGNYTLDATALTRLFNSTK